VFPVYRKQKTFANGKRLQKKPARRLTINNTPRQRPGDGACLNERSHLRQLDNTTDQAVRKPQFLGIHTKNTVLKIAQALEFMLRIFFFCLSKNIKVVNVHTLSLLPLGVILKLIKPSVLIYNIHELETEKLGWSNFRKSVTKMVERIFIKYVDRTIVVSPSIARWYADKYRIQPTIILNATHPHKQHRNMQKVIDRFQIPHDTTVFVYAGSLTTGRGIEKLINAFGQINSCEKIIIFLGYGDYYQKIAESQKYYKNIYLHPPAPFDELPVAIQGAHFGFALIEKVCLSYYYSLPTKLFDYISAGIPIICSNMPELHRLVQKNQIGIVIDDLSVHRIREVVQSVDQNTSRRYAKNVGKIQSVYSWKNEEKKIFEIYDSIL